MRKLRKADCPGKFGWNKALGVAAAAIAMAFALSIFTQPGQAALEKLKQYFRPEKVVEYEVEVTRKTLTPDCSKVKWAMFCTTIRNAIR